MKVIRQCATQLELFLIILVIPHPLRDIALLVLVYLPLTRILIETTINVYWPLNFLCHQLILMHDELIAIVTAFKLFII